MFKCWLPRLSEFFSGLGFKEIDLSDQTELYSRLGQWAFAARGIISF
jgi:hypothetical protein